MDPTQRIVSSFTPVGSSEPELAPSPAPAPCTPLEGKDMCLRCSKHLAKDPTIRCVRKHEFAKCARCAAGKSPCHPVGTSRIKGVSELTLRQVPLRFRDELYAMQQLADLANGVAPLSAGVAPLAAGVAPLSALEEAGKAYVARVEAFLRKSRPSNPKKRSASPSGDEPEVTRYLRNIQAQLGGILLLLSKAVSSSSLPEHATY